MSTAGGRLEGRVALITGAARGQGEATARRFVEEGATVVLTDVLDDVGKALADELGGAASYAHLDVTDEDAWRQVVSQIEGEHGRLEVLVNNAGILAFNDIDQMTQAEYRKVIDINQVGTFLGMHVAIPLMKAGRKGSIINVSSVEGMAGLPGTVAYAASKWAVRGMTKVAALELGPYGVRVNSIHPGAIDTDMIRRLGDVEIDTTWLGNTVPLLRCGTPEDVANLTLFLASDESAYSTGAEFIIDGGATAVTGFGWKPSIKFH